MMNIIEGEAASTQGAAALGVRPEHVTLSPDQGLWQGTVGVSEHLGSDTFIRVDVDGVPETMTVRAPGKVRLNYRDRVFVTPQEASMHRFDAEGLRVS